MVAGPEMVRRLCSFEDKFMNNTKTDFLHHDENKAADNLFRKNVESLLNVMNEHGNPFDEESSDMYSLVSKRIFRPESVQSIRKLMEVGTKQFNEFMTDRLIKKTKPFYAAIHKNKLPLLNFVPKSVQSKKNDKMKTILKSQKLFSLLFLISQSRPVDLSELFKYENQHYPPAFACNGIMRHNTKSDILKCIEPTHQKDEDETQILSMCSAYGIERAFLVHMLKPGSNNTFQEYARNVFNKYLKTFVNNYERVDIVWDIYKEASIKSGTRMARGTGLKQKVSANVKLPKNWEIFLRVDENKAALFKYLAQEIFADPELKLSNTIIISTFGESVLSNRNFINRCNIEPCNHEESDSRIMVHLKDMVDAGHTNIILKSVDSDVVLLGTSAFATLKIIGESIQHLWIQSGVQKNFRYIPVHKIVEILGYEKARVLCLFHGLSGCDTKSCPYCKGKKTFWDTWCIFPELTKCLSRLLDDPTKIDEEFPVIEKFFVLLYDHSSELTNVNDARRHMYKNSLSLELIPPTQAALYQHVKRSILQGAYIWGKCMERMPDIPDPTDFGWSLVENQFQPLWTTLPESSQAINTTRCGCKVSCKGRCSCKGKCTLLCKCEGRCYT